MKKILVIVLILFSVLTYGFESGKKNITDSSIIKKRYIGIGFPKALWPIGLPNLFSKGNFYQASDMLFNTSGYINICIVNEIPIKNNLVFCNYLRYDMNTGTNPFLSNVIVFYKNHGINFYPSINYVNKNRRLKAGLGLSIIMANMRILNSNKKEIFEPKTYLYASPFLHLKFDIVNKENYKISLFSYIGYSFYSNNKNDYQFNGYRNSIIVNGGFGNNFKIKNMFNNFIGINYEINY
jgi:hypothetical protein